MPEITRFGPGNAADNTGAGGVTWFDIDIADDADREWLMAWQEINEQTRQALLEPVRFNHYEQVPDGTLLSIRTLRPGPTEDLADLADLKLLIGPTRAITVRSGTVAAVHELRRNLSSDRSLVTAVDLLGFMVSGIIKRMEADHLRADPRHRCRRGCTARRRFSTAPADADRASAPNLSHQTASEFQPAGACFDDDRSRPGAGCRRS